MKFTDLYDFHTHSDMSFDGQDSCDLLCENAIKAGLSGIAITDHLDIDGMVQKAEAFTAQQIDAVQKVKQQYSNQLSVYKGIELGQGIYQKALSERILAAHDYDVVLGSVHNLEDMQDFYFLEYTPETAQKWLQEYFEAELLLAQWNQADVLAHLTYPLRYICGRDKISIDLTQYDELIDEIFSALIQNRKALEINTSGLWMPLQDTMPPARYLQRFKELGGKYVTIGSDAHTGENIGKGMQEALNILQACGFTHYTIYCRREPQLIKIQ